MRTETETGQMTLVWQRNGGRFCSRCQRDLEDPISSDIGIGPVCRGKSNVLFAKSIPANYAFATAVLLGIRAEMLPEAVLPRFEIMKDMLITKASKAQQSNFDVEVIRLDGQDLRNIIKEIDWIMSWKMDPAARKFFIKVVGFLGYVGLAGVLSQEASTSPAVVWFDPTTGSISVQGKFCKSAFFAMKKVPGIKLPKYRMGGLYTAPANQTDKFLEVVQEFYPMWEVKLENGTCSGELSSLDQVRAQAKLWQELNPMPLVSETVPESTAKIKTVCMADGTRWVEFSFPWVSGKTTEMYGMINGLKAQIPFRDRKYNPGTKSWMTRENYKSVVETLLSKLFTVLSSPC